MDWRHVFVFSVRERFTLIRSAAACAALGATAASLPFGLAALTGSPHEMWMADLGIAGRFALLGALYGAIIGAVIACALISISPAGHKRYLIAPAGGAICGIVAELLTWHHVEGFIVILGIIGGLLVSLVTCGLWSNDGSRAG